MAATTSGGTKTWKSEFAENYRGAKEVWVIPDNDDEGADYAAKVAQDLLGVAETVKSSSSLACQRRVISPTG